MGLISGLDAYLINAVFSASMALVLLGVLWRVRGLAVYLYAASTVCSAVYFFTLVSAPEGRLSESLLHLWLIGLSSIGGTALKLTAIGVVGWPDYPLTNYRRGALIIILGVLALPFFAPDPRVFSMLLALSVAFLMGRGCQLAYRLGRTVPSAAAKVFAILIGLQLVILVVGTLSMIVTTDMHLLTQPYSEQGTLGLGINLGLALLNTGLFIALFFDINLSEREAAQRRLVALEVARTQAQERELLLADMHDGLGSQISSARLRVERGEMTQPEVAELLRECSADIHLMVDTLREQNDGLEAALVDYRTRIERRMAEQGMGLSWAVALEGAPPMAARRMLQVLRVIQESITNAVRHARARQITVSVRYAATSGYLIRIEDDGVGITDDASPGRGLANMRRRARELDGVLDIRRVSATGGTVVTLTFADRRDAKSA